MTAFEFHPTTKLVFGPGTLARLGECAREVGGRRILIVTDPGIHKAGHVARALASLDAIGLPSVVFDRVEENPTTRHVDICAEFAKRERIDLIVGLGGGSSMDTAKGANFILTNGGVMADYRGYGKATKPMLPMIAIPTTAGTGSEGQSYALIADEATHQKMACGDKKAAFKIAILDPEATISCPPAVTAVCGMDAISHAVESFVCRRRNRISCLFAKEAWQLMRKAFPKVFAQPSDMESRGQMLLGSHLAGIAIESSMLGATHSAANPLTAHFKTTHGTAIGVMLPHVVRFNAVVCDDLYAELLGLSPGDPTSKDSAGATLADELEQLRKTAGLATSLQALSVPKAIIPELAAEAAEQWTAQFNPRGVDRNDFEALYANAYNTPGV